MTRSWSTASRIWATRSEGLKRNVHTRPPLTAWRIVTDSCLARISNWFLIPEKLLRHSLCAVWEWTTTSFWHQGFLERILEKFPVNRSDTCGLDYLPISTPELVSVRVPSLSFHAVARTYRTSRRKDNPQSDCMALCSTRRPLAVIGRVLCMRLARSLSFPACCPCGSRRIFGAEDEKYNCLYAVERCTNKPQRHHASNLGSKALFVQPSRKFLFWCACCFCQGCHKLASLQLAKSRNAGCTN